MPNITPKDRKIKSRHKVTHYGEFELVPGVVLECAVLDDGRRGFIQRQMVQAVGFKGGDRNARFGRFCSKIGIKSLNDNEKTECPVLTVGMPNGGTAEWVVCDTLVDVVKGGAIAFYAGKLTKQQQHIGERCAHLSSALIGVGLTALIDEATGYQHSRKDDALQEMYARLIRPVARDWDRRFHPDYYNALCGLFGFTYGNRHRALPPIIGQITEKWVYLAVMPKEVIEEIRARRKDEKLHQWLTEGDGLRILENQIREVTTIARTSVDYKDFDARCARSFSRPGQQLGMIFPNGGRAA